MADNTSKTEGTSESQHSNNAVLADVLFRGSIEWSKLPLQVQEKFCADYSMGKLRLVDKLKKFFDEENPLIQVRMSIGEIQERLLAEILKEKKNIG